MGDDDLQRVIGELTARTHALESRLLEVSTKLNAVAAKQSWAMGIAAALLFVFSVLGWFVGDNLEDFLERWRR